MARKYLDNTGLAHAFSLLKELISGKADTSHKHAAGDITSGTLPVARGGTGNTSVDTTPTSGSTKMVTSGGVYTSLSGKANSSHSHALTDCTGTLTVAKGGTGATTAADARTNLGITLANLGAAAASHSHAAGDITSGILPVARGGTGNSSVDTTPTSGSTKMVTSGGVYTALSGKANSNHSHALADCTGTLSIEKGGTGATTAAAARTALGITLANLGAAASSHSHDAASQSAAGFMSAADKKKLDGITAGATAITVDTGLSSTSTNPVQNKVINSALAGKAASNHSHALTDCTGTLSIAKGGTGATDAETARTNLGITLANLGAAAASHTHKYAGSSSAGGAATSANKVNSTLVIKGAGTSVEAFNGSAAGEVDFVAGSNVTVTAEDGKITIAATNSDTKNTTGTTNKAATKLYLAGATSQAASPVTYSNSNVYVTTDNGLAAAEFYRGGLASVRVFGTLIPYGTSIPSNADLNTTTYMKVGNYFCSANATVATLTNCPTTSAFMMQVLSPLSTTIDNETTKTWVYRLRKMQVYTGEEYVQYCYAGATAGTWTCGAWKKTARTDDFVAATNAEIDAAIAAL